MLNRIISNQGWLLINIGKLLLPFYLTFLLFRIILLIAYPNDFGGLSAGQITYAMVRGAWIFDSSILAIALGLPIWFSLFPGRWFTSHLWHAIVGWYGFVIYVITLFALIADTLYFAEVHRHVGSELGAAVKSDPQLLLSIALGGYWHYLLLFAAAIVLLFLLWRKGIRRLNIVTDAEPPHWLIRTPLLIIVLALIVITARGSVTSKPIKPVYAFDGVTMAEGYLALNGLFAGAHALFSKTAPASHFYPQQEAEKVVRAMLASEDETAVDPGYPLMRELVSRRSHAVPLNIVVLLLESWDAEHVDITRQLDGLEPFNVTPNFDALARQGVLFSRFYANGQRSIEAIAALLTGIPATPSAGYMGEGVETNNFIWLGRLAKQRGYNTYMLQGSRRASFYLDKIAPLAGFDHYLGSEDFVPSLHTEVKTPAWGGWDYDLFMHANDQFASSDKPFLGFVFSVSTHIPFGIPDKQWQRFPGKSKQGKFLNSLYYSDWALGEFFKQAKKAGYYDNTIFILVADHASGLGKKLDIPSQHHIPLLVVAPGLKPGVSETVGSQSDVIPTVIDLAGWQAVHASLGNSMLARQRNSGALVKRDNIIGRIEKDAVLLHNFHNRIDYSGPPEKADTMEKKLLSSVQVIDIAIKQNRIMAPQKIEAQK